MQNPFIPLKQANLAIIDGRVDDIIVKSLEKLKIRVIKTIKCVDVQESISYHPDIVLHPIDHETIIVAPNVYDYYEASLSNLGIKVIKGEAILKYDYPNDVAYNVGRLKDIAIHNFKFTDEKLKFYLKKKNLNFINVNQGYTKCSLAIVDDISAITSDNYLYRVLTRLGYNVLLIEPGYINLINEKYGFIGGTTGNLSHNTILFSGTFNQHPDYNKIVKFIDERGKKIFYLSDNQITDIGTIINFNYIC